MHNYDADIWELLFFRKCAIGLGYVGAWYHTRFRYRILDHLLTLALLLMGSCNACMSVASTLYFVSASYPTVADVSLGMKLILTMWFGNFQLISTYAQKKSYSEIISDMEEYTRKCVQIFGKQNFSRDMASGNRQVKRIYYIWLCLWSTVVFFWSLIPAIKGLIRLRKEDRLAELFAGTNETLVRSRRFYDLRVKVQLYTDNEASPTYEILFIMQLLTLIFQTMNLMFYDVAYFGFLLTACALIRHINSIMSTLYTSQFEYDPRKVNIATCIYLHQKLVLIIEKYLKYMGPMIFIICCRSGEQFILIAFTGAKVSSHDPKFHLSIVFLVFYLLQLFVYSWNSDSLKFESLKTPDAIYLCDWATEPNPSHRMAIRFIMMRSQKAILIRGFNFFILDLALMINIVQTSFSVFTLLNSLSEDEEHNE